MLLPASNMVIKRMEGRLIVHTFDEYAMQSFPWNMETSKGQVTDYKKLKFWNRLVAVV
jgi:hypothetical protein